MTPKEYIEGFDKRFNFFENIRITPRYTDGFEKARILQRFYQNSGEEIKSFLISTVISVLKEQVEEINKFLEGDGQPHDDAMELHQAITWTEGHNHALSNIRLSLENKIKEWELLDNK